MNHAKGHTTRRAALGGLAAAPVAAPAIVQAAPRRVLDFNDPDDQLYALVKMTGDLEDGKETVGWMKGIVHAILEDGKILEPIFYAGSLSFSRSYKQEDGSYKNMSNFTICYMDLETGEVMDSWYNPWLEKTVEVVNYASTLHTIVKPMEPINDHTRLRIEWMVDGNDVIRWSDGKMKKRTQSRRTSGQERLSVRPITKTSRPRSLPGGTNWRTRTSRPYHPSPWVNGMGPGTPGS